MIHGWLAATSTGVCLIMHRARCGHLTPDSDFDVDCSVRRLLCPLLEYAFLYLDGGACPCARCPSFVDIERSSAKDERSLVMASECLLGLEEM